MRNWEIMARPLFGRVGLDIGLWAGALVGAVVAGVVYYEHAGPVTRFLTALVAVGFTAAVLGRAVDQVAGRLSPGAVGLFQAATGNLPELVIGAFALENGLYSVVQGTIAGAVLNMLLFGNGLAYLAGGLRHGSMDIDTEQAQNTCVMLVLMVATLVMPAVAVELKTPAAHHAVAVSYVAAVVLLVVFAVALPEIVGQRPDNDDQDEDQDRAARPARTVPDPATRQPLGRALVALVVAGLLLGEEANWLTDPMGPALARLHINPGFAGLFLLGTIANLSQVGPAVQLAWRGDADTATAINLDGALQDALMTAPLLMLLSPLLGASGFTLIFSPLMVISLVAAALLVVFVILDGEVNHLEGVMLLGLYTVLGSLFWWS
jgi:Ca2+:H+ antiporter